MLTYAKIRDARKGGKVRDYDYNGLSKEIARIVTLAHVTRGSKAEPNDVQITACELAAKVREDFPKLYLKEIELAVREGLYSGKQTFGVNAVGLYGLIRDYCADDLVKQSKFDADYTAPQLAADNRTEDEKTREFLRKDYDYIRKHGQPADFRLAYPRGTFCYDYLVKCGQLTAEAWRAFADKATQQRHKNVFVEAFDTTDRVILAKALTVNAYLMQKAQK